MKRILLVSIYAVAVAMTWDALSTRCEAGYREDAISDIYEQLSESNYAEVDYNGSELPDYTEIYEYAVTHDDPDNLYDGAMICGTRGYIKTRLENGKYTAVLNKTYDIEEADALANTMVKEISADLREDANQREKMAAICDYITANFDYDSEASNAVANEDYDKVTHFVDAYYGDRKILCTEYAALTYLLANKMGIQCDLYYGKGHVYNIVKFDDSENWIGYDLASDNRYAQITLMDCLRNNELYDVSGTDRRSTDAQTANNGKTYEMAPISELIISGLYFGLKAHHAEEVIGMIVCIAIIIAIITFVINKAHKALTYRTKKSYSRKKRYAKA